MIHPISEVVFSVDNCQTQPHSNQWSILYYNLGTVINFSEVVRVYKQVTNVLLFSIIISLPALLTF